MTFGYVVDNAVDVSINVGIELPLGSSSDAAHDLCFIKSTEVRCVYGGYVTGGEETSSH